MNNTETQNGLGLCPICRGKGVSCERCPNGKTFCENGHNYPHTKRVYTTDVRATQHFDGTFADFLKLKQ